MRITLLGPVHPYRGGISHFNTRLAIELKNAGHEVQVISFSRQYPSWLYPGKTDKDPSKEYLHVEAEYILDPLYSWTWLRAYNTIRAWKPELILIQWWTTFWAPAFATLSFMLRRTHLTVVYIIHNVTPHEKKWFDEWLAKSALCQGNQLIVLSNREKTRLLNLLPHANVRETNLPNYDFFIPERYNLISARQKLNLPLELPIALFFGIVRPYKGLYNTIRAIAILRNKGINIKLIVAGEFWEDINYYLNLIHELELESNVIIENRYIPNESVSLYFSSADFLLAPYSEGTQSGVIGIAIQHGLPIITTPHIIDGIDLELVEIPIQIIPPKNEEHLANAIEKWALSTTQLRNQRTKGKTNCEWQNLVSYIIETVSYSEYCN